MHKQLKTTTAKYSVYWLYTTQVVFNSNNAFPFEWIQGVGRPLKSTRRGLAIQVIGAWMKNLNGHVNLKMFHVITPKLKLLEIYVKKIEGPK